MTLSQFDPTKRTRQGPSLPGARFILFLAGCSSGCGTPEPASAVTASTRVDTPVLDSSISDAASKPADEKPPLRSGGNLEGGAWDSNLPETASCRIVDDIELGDVELKLRTRIDAMPSMVLRQGHTTLWLGNAKRRPGVGPRPQALVEVTSGDLTLRGVVGEEHIQVLLGTATKVMDHFVADTFTDRSVLRVSDEWITVSVDFEGLMSTSAEVECEGLSLRRKREDVRGLLPPSTRENVVLRPNAPLITEDDTLEVKVLQTFGSHQPAGPLANLHGAPNNQGQLVSLITCGGLLYGHVSPRDVLGTSRLAWGSSARCPNTGRHAFAGDGSSQPTHRCPKALPIYLATGTLEDRVGTLTAGGAIRVVRKLSHRTTVVAPALSPVELVEAAEFVVDDRELANCDELAPTPLRADDETAGG